MPSGLQLPFRRRFSRFIFFPFALACVLIWTAIPSRAQVVDFTATAGYEGRARVGMYAPLSITLRAGARTRGTIQIFSNNAEVCRIPYALRDGEILRLRKNLHLSTHGLRVECYDENDSLVAKLSQFQIITQHFYRNEIHILDVSRTPFRVAGLSKFRFNNRNNANANNPSSSSQQQQDILTSHIEPDAVPEHSRMLESVDAIIIGDAPLDEFSIPARTALMNWVYRGGLLIVRGGANASELERSFLAPYLPLEGMRSVTTQGGFPSIAAAEYTPFALIEGSRKSRGERRAQGLEEGITRNGWDTLFGAGRIRLLRFDPADHPFREDDSTANLVFNPSDAEIFDLNSNTDQYGNNIYQPHGNFSNVGLSFPLNLVAQVADLPAPPITLITLFLLGYIILVGPVNFWILSRFGRREYAWGSIPVVVLVFTTAALGVGYGRMGASTVYREFSIIFSDMNEGTSEIETTGGIFSATSRSYRLMMPPDAVSAHEIVDQNQPIDNPVLFLGPRPDQSQKFVVNQWSWKFIRSLGVMRPDHVVTFDSAAQHVSVDGNLDLTNAYIRLNHTYRLLTKDTEGGYKVSWEKSSLSEPEFSQLDLSQAHYNGTVIIARRTGEQARLAVDGTDSREVTDIFVIRPKILGVE